MAKKKRKVRRKRQVKPKPPRSVPASRQISHLLDVISVASVTRGLELSERVGAYYRQLYQELAQQRAGCYPALCEALRIVAKPLEAKSWTRRVSWAYTLNPLSPAGSIKSVGGRFNVGRGLGLGGIQLIQPFPMLYLAQDDVTASAEVLGAAHRKGLNPDEFALQNRPGSYSMVEVSASLSRVLDLRESATLEAFVSCTETFQLGPLVASMARALKWNVPVVIQDAKGLLATLLARDWKACVSLADVPSNSQIFGKIALDAGIQGILYPSIHTGKVCLSVFPNLETSNDVVECLGARPREAGITRLDAGNFSRGQWERIFG